MARKALRVLLCMFMICMGALHLTAPHPFVKAVPDYLPYPEALVMISALCEIAGGMGLIFKRTRRPAALGLIALFCAVFPANVNMAMHPDEWVTPGHAWILYLRLPLQVLLIAWALFVGGNESPISGAHTFDTTP